MDPVLIIIAVLLIASLLAFIGGLFPYPYGLLVLLIFFVARLLAIQNKKSP